MSTGFIYAIGASNGLVKIGWSEKPDRRLAKIASDCACECTLLGFAPGDKEREQELHSRFSAFHSHREWFRNDGIVAEFVAVLPQPIARVLCWSEADPIVHIRKRLFQMSQIAFAEMLDLDNTAISRVESGRRELKLSEMARIRKAARARGLPWSDQWFFEAMPAAESAA